MWVIEDPAVIYVRECFAVARTSNAMLNRSCESKNPCLAPYFNRKAFSYSLLSILLTELVINDFYYIDICPLYTHFGKFLS